jgi:hypothetical protein
VHATDQRRGPADQERRATASASATPGLAAPQAADDQQPPDPGLSLEARLALTDAAMTLRLQEALVRLGIDSAHVETVPAVEGFTVEGLATYTATAPRPAPDLYPTPVAALLQVAAERLQAGGWCRGAMVNEQGARCLYGAIHVEASGSTSLESAALDILLEAIRREFDAGTETVPAFNDSLGGPRVALRLLDSAARLADARGL